MIWEFFNVLWYYELDSAVFRWKTRDFKDLHVISQYILCHLIRAHIDYFNVRVLASRKYSTNLGIFSLQEFFHAHSFHFVDGERIDMNLNSFPLLYNLPVLLEIIHHLSPDKHIVCVLLLYTVFCLLLEYIKSEGFLDFRSLWNQKSQVSVSNTGFMHTPVFLNASSGKYGSLVTLVHKTWNFYATSDIIFVLNTVKQLFISRFTRKVNFTAEAQRSYFSTVHVCHFNIWVL